MSVVMVTHLMSVILGKLFFSSNLILLVLLFVRLTCSSVSPTRRLHDVAPTMDGTSLTLVKMNHSGKNISLRLVDRKYNFYLANPRFSGNLSEM